MVCTLCKRDSTSSICDACKEKLGVIDMPPGRRPRKPCLHCNGLTFVRVIPREYTGYEPGAIIEPMTLTQPPRIVEGLFGVVSVKQPRTTHGHGLLETYTCLTCGYVEWWCLDPREIPIGAAYMSELVDCTPDAPYR
jgi:hypothetical protein